MAFPTVAAAAVSQVRIVFKKLHPSGIIRAVVLFFLSVAVSTLLITDRASGQLTQISGGQTRILTNLQTGSTYTVLASDCGKLLSLSNASGMTVTLPPAGAGGLANGCWLDLQNTGAGSVTLTSGGSLIDGILSLSLTSNQGLRLVSTGTAYYTQRGQGQGQSQNSGGGGGGGSLAIQSAGVPLGTASTMNVAAGIGVSCIPQVNNDVLTFQCNADTSYVATKVNLQGGANPQICKSSSASGTTYTAACSSALTAYAAMQTLFWYADVTNSGTAPTLNIDNGNVPQNPAQRLQRRQMGHAARDEDV